MKSFQSLVEKLTLSEFDCFIELFIYFSRIDRFSSSSSSRMKTVASLRRDEEESSDSSDDEGQAFYAGGSETRLCIILFIMVIELYKIIPFVCFTFY